VAHPVAVHRRGGGQYEAVHAAGDQGLQQPQRGGGVVAEECLAAAHRLRFDRRGEVHAGTHPAGDDSAHQGGVLHGALHELGAVGDGAGGAGAQVVQHHHVVARVEQCDCGGRPDVAGTPG